MKSLSQILTSARQHQTAIPAFNIDSMKNDDEFKKLFGV